MKQLNFMVFSFLSVFMVFSLAFGLDINSDHRAVYAILTANHLDSNLISLFCTESGGRVTELKHDGRFYWDATTNKQLTIIPTEICSLTALTWFEIPYNSITHISDMCSLTKLSYMDISNNLLDSLPEINYSQFYIENFIIHTNNLKVLPDSIGNLKISGDTLRLDHNSLTSIPSTISHLTSLVSLRLEYNRLDSIPVNIRTMPSLVQVWAFHNQMSSVPNWTIKEIDSLKIKELDLNDNYICAPNAAYNELNKLGILRAENQNCTTIESQPSLPFSPSVYPNPFHGTTFIKTHSLIRIFDVSGRVVFQTLKSTTFNAIPGIYIMENNGNTQKLISVR